MQLLLVASNKTFTRRCWLAKTPPTLDDWFGAVLEMFRMEKLTFKLRTQQEIFFNDIYWHCFFLIC